MHEQSFPRSRNSTLPDAIFLSRSRTPIVQYHRQPRKGDRYPGCYQCAGIGFGTRCSSPASVTLSKIWVAASVSAQKYFGWPTGLKTGCDSPRQCFQATSSRVSMIGLTAIQSARSRLMGNILPTPLVPSPTLTEICGVPVRLKLEHHQITGSFKLRGATNAVVKLTNAERAVGVRCGLDRQPRQRPLVCGPRRRLACDHLHVTPGPGK